jgi:two-component system, response regulator PdtaR
MGNINEHSAQILVVEDDPSIAAVLEEILTGKDYTVRVANNPEQAIAAVGALLPELVLMDINLSSDIDGIETARRLRNDHEDLPVCFITAFSDDETVNRAEEVGPMAYLVKPFEMADVLTMVSISLSSARRMRDRVKKLVAQGAAPPQAAVTHAPIVSLSVAVAAAPKRSTTEDFEDKLTGLPNRRAVERLVEGWDEDETQKFVAVLTVDHVALLRQRFGGAALDQILFSYSQHLGQHLPDYCLLGRWEAATFVVTPRQGGSEAQREVARVVSTPMLYHLRLPGRSALLRVSSSLKVLVPGEMPLPEQVDAAIAHHR